MDTNNKEINRFIKDFAACGWRYVVGRKHIKMYAPDSSTILVLSKTPGDYRELRKLRKEYKAWA